MNREVFHLNGISLFSEASFVKLILGEDSVQLAK